MAATPAEGAPSPYLYLGPAVGAVRSVVLADLEQRPAEWLKDVLSTLGISRQGAQEPADLAQRLLGGAKLAVLATADAARSHGLVLPSPEEEAAGLQGLLAVAAGDRGAGDKPMIALDAPLHEGELLLVMAPAARMLVPRVEARLGRRLVPPGFTWEAQADSQPGAPAEGSEEEPQPQQPAVDPQQLVQFLDSVLQHAAAREGFQLSQLPHQALLQLRGQAFQLVHQRLLSGQTSAVPTRPGHFSVMLQATQDDIEQLRAAIRALRLPPAPSVLRCAACGAADDPPIRKLRRCAACSRVLYCSTACQRSDWPQHKAACKAARSSG